jgi:two-component system C4-dicarboxylate transport response regulator DctD
MNQPVALIVDDEPLLREILREEFEMAGYQVLEADGGRAALALLKERGASVVVSDVRMPGGSGLELLDAIVAMGPGRPPVFLVTGFSDTDREGALARGAADLFEKPYRVSDLLRAVAARLKSAA